MRAFFNYQPRLRHPNGIRRSHRLSQLLFSLPGILPRLMTAAARCDGHSCLLKSRPQLRFFEDSQHFSFLFLFDYCLSWNTTLFFFFPIMDGARSNNAQLGKLTRCDRLGVKNRRRGADAEASGCFVLFSLVFLLLSKSWQPVKCDRSTNILLALDWWLTGLFLPRSNYCYLLIKVLLKFLICF